MPWTTIAASMLPSLVGGIFQSRENRKNRKAAQEAVGIDYAKLRDDASAAGFNPLTALLAGGGQGYQRQFQPSLSSGSFVAEAMQRGVDTYFDVRGEQQDQEVASLRKMLEKSQAAQAVQAAQPPGQFGFDLQTVEPFRPAVSGGGPAMRPQARPSASDHRGRIPVFNPFGNPVQILPDVAARLGLNAWDTMMAEEWSGSGGEYTEAEIAAGMHNVRRTQFNTGVFSSTPGTPLRYPELPPRSGLNHQGNQRNTLDWLQDLPNW